MAEKIKPLFLSSNVVKKGWGEEIWMVNNDKYCGKLLRFNKSSKFSMHFHIIKDETWYILEGVFIFRYIDGKTADIIEKTLIKGDTVRIPSYLPHQLETHEGGTIIEISTQHFDSDSIRVLKGDSQLKHPKI